MKFRGLPDKYSIAYKNLAGPKADFLSVMADFCKFFQRLGGGGLQPSSPV